MVSQGCLNVTLVCHHLDDWSGTKAFRQIYVRWWEKYIVNTSEDTFWVSLMLKNKWQANVNVYMFTKGCTLTSSLPYQLFLNWFFEIESIDATNFWASLNLKNKDMNFFALAASCSMGTNAVEGKSFRIEGGRQRVNNLLSFEKMNLFPAAPEKTIKLWPRMEVLNTLEEYLAVLFETNLSTAPS